MTQFLKNPHAGRSIGVTQPSTFSGYQPPTPNEWFVIRAGGEFAAIKGRPIDSRQVYFAAHTKHTCTAWMQYQDERDAAMRVAAEWCGRAIALAAVVGLFVWGLS